MTPDKCPKCGANRRLPKIYLDPVFDCGSHIWVMDLVESRRCLVRQRDQLLARVKRLEEAGARMYPHFAKRDTPHKKALADEWEEAVR